MIKHIGLSRCIGPIAVIAIVAAVSIGCSNQNPTGPTSSTSAIQTVGPLVENRGGKSSDSFGYEGLVERVDYDKGVVYFAKNFTVLVLDNTTVRLWGSNRLIAFDRQYVRAGATITAHGTYKESGAAVADLLEVHVEVQDNTVRSAAN